MESLVASYKKNKSLHHAYFLVGEQEEIYENLISFLESELKLKVSGNPDFWSGKYQNLNIESAREIGEWNDRKDFSGNKKIFIIQTDFISEEAQNSLLKVFEEPTAGTHFFIISPQDILLPTLRSRMQIILSNRVQNKTQSILKLSLPERLEKVKEIIEGISDEEKTKQDAIIFLNLVEEELHNKEVDKTATSLKVCELTRASLYDRGAPVKMILENLVLSI